MSSARDQSRKIKDFLEHWLERFRVSRTARESNPIEEGKYIETRTNEWGSKRESTIPRPRVRFRSFPPCHLGALLYDTRAIFWGRESRTDISPRIEQRRSRNVSQLRKYIPGWKHLLLCHLFPPLRTLPRLPRYNARCSSFFLFSAFRLRAASTPLTHTWQSRTRIYVTICISSRSKFPR